MTPASLALSLLLILLHEPLGYCIPLPHVPRLCGYVLELFTNVGGAQG